MKSCYYIDGEAAILGPGMEQETVDLYNLNEINGVKGYPNGTGLHQSYDVSTGYMGCHSGVKKVHNESTDVSNELLKSTLNLYFEDFKHEFPTITLSASFKKKIVYGCEVMVYVWPTALTGPKLAKAFKKNAQVAKDPSYQFPGYSETTIDLRRLIGFCESDVSDEELANFESHLPLLVANVRRAGENTDVEMDALGIMKTEGTASRDGNVYNIILILVVNNKFNYQLFVNLFKGFLQEKCICIHQSKSS